MPLWLVDLAFFSGLALLIAIPWAWESIFRHRRQVTQLRKSLTENGFTSTGQEPFFTFTILSGGYGNILERNGIHAIAGVKSSLQYATPIAAFVSPLNTHGSNNFYAISKSYYRLYGYSLGKRPVGETDHYFISGDIDSAVSTLKKLCLLDDDNAAIEITNSYLVCVLFMTGENDSNRIHEAVLRLQKNTSFERT